MVTVVPEPTSLARAISSWRSWPLSSSIAKNTRFSPAAGADVVLLDNMTPEQVREAAARAHARRPGPRLMMPLKIDIGMQGADLATSRLWGR